MMRLLAGDDDVGGGLDQQIADSVLIKRAWKETEFLYHGSFPPPGHRGASEVLVASRGNDKNLIKKKKTDRI